ncbi:PREDICTED: histidine-containing phosphotransfer protein 1-like isoform X3 [Theobroma cacao]|uniref:Histidine-containing phosphotransfer protein n=1 Tax=Theobroma cacao TaxID=3641 RepID=A0AB32WSE3_THECC|nr:PREDICTED: histidine-containing phosphotransfer protein 1-like isoform X3 [Theobroma cacao]
MVGRADHFVQLINTYCLNVETILSKLESYIDLPNVDFSNLAALATEIEERSSCIGAEHVRLTCLDLMRACDQMQKQKYETFFFCQALSWTKNEFAHTRNKLQVLVQWLLNLSALAASNADGAEDYEARSKTAKIECYQVVFLNVQ